MTQGKKDSDDANKARHYAFKLEEVRNQQAHQQQNTKG